MRVRRISVLAVGLVAAGLSLTACNNDGTNGASSSSTSSASNSTTSPSTSTGTSQTDAPQPASGQNAASTNSPGAASGNGANSSTNGATGSTCQTANLSFTASHGMGEGEFLINLKNTGAQTCSMHGFPGVDLKGSNGNVSAARSTVSAPHVTLKPGQETRFTLHYPPNNSGGSGVTFTSLVVTPPNETHSHTMALSVNIPVGSNAGPAITVDPVGAGK